MQVTIPILVLVAFAVWTLLTLLFSVGIYRWSRILTGAASIAEWRADVPGGSEWYKRAMRAHMNCVENLPVYTALVVALMAARIQSATVDGLAIALLLARIAQTLIHLMLRQTNVVAGIRFTFFFVQFVCMMAIAVIILSPAMYR
jgi:uncharacterized MAPEG superfamily protein